MADKSSKMMTHKITPSLDYNQWLKSLDTHLNEPTNQNSTKAPKVVKPSNKKRYYKTLGTSSKDSPMSPASLILSTWKLWKFVSTECL